MRVRSGDWQGRFRRKNRHWLIRGMLLLAGDRQMNRTTEAATLLEQARRLRELALRFDQAIIKDDVLRLSERCEELAQTANDAVVRGWHYGTTASTAGASLRRPPQPGTIEEVSEPTHELLKNVHAYWIAKRGYRIAPPWSALQLDEMAAFLPHITLIAVDLPRFRFWYCGTRVAQAYGEDVTGKSFDEVDLGSLKRDVVSVFTKIARECRPQFARIRFTKQQDERYVDYERIALPLSDDGRTVNMILCAYAYRRVCLNAVTGNMIKPLA